MNKLQEDKSRLREKFKKIRSELSPGEIKVKSEQILHQVAGMESFINAEVVHLYRSISENSEVDTDKFLHYCFQSEKTVVVPSMSGGGKLTHYKVDQNTEWSENRWGILEPVKAEEFLIKSLSIILVPMLSGDHQKNRLGYGKGYYDRFLSKTNAVKTGLLFDSLLSESPLPVGQFDVPLDYIVTESRIIR